MIKVINLYFSQKFQHISKVKGETRGTEEHDTTLSRCQSNVNIVSEYIFIQWLLKYV